MMRSYICDSFKLLSLKWLLCCCLLIRRDIHIEKARYRCQWRCVSCMVIRGFLLRRRVFVEGKWKLEECSAAAVAITGVLCRCFYSFHFQLFLLLYVADVNGAMMWALVKISSPLSYVGNRNLWSGNKYCIYDILTFYPRLQHTAPIH